MATADTGIEGAEALSADINKAKKDGTEETSQGASPPKMPDLDIAMSDDDIVKLTDIWEKKWKDSDKRAEWEKQGEENQRYWLGLQFEKPKADKSRPMVDNIIFESLETFLPQATRRNPEPLVTLEAGESDELGNINEAKQKYVQKVKMKLADIADKNVLRLKIKKGARHWALYLLGVAKFGWDMDRGIPATRIIRPQRIILDPDASIDDDGYSGEYIGEYRRMSASKLLKIIKDEKNYAKSSELISELTQEDGEGTVIKFQEWWTREYVCWKLNKNILLKKKNLNWNYDQEETPSPEDMASPGVNVDDYGRVTTTPVSIPGFNHLPSPAMPYSFLTIFNLGDRPMDITSLIGQNLSNQDMLNKRNSQTDKNTDRMNGGMVVSLANSGLTSTQAKGVTATLRRGGVIAIPKGVPREAIDDYAPTSLPSDIFNQINDLRARMRDIFGVKGSSQAGLETERTVRGKILGRTTDTDRIGGGVTEYLEQWADDWYNWIVQLLYVHDPAFRFIEGAVPPKIVVSVKEGSLLPKDSLTLSQQAIDLAVAGKMSVLDMYKRLEYPNPEEMAANVWLEVNAPQILYKNSPEVQEALALSMQAGLAQAGAERDNQEREHERTIERDQVKNEGQIEKETAKSLLAAVPQRVQ